MRGLYKGATPPMLLTGFINSVMFGLMGMCKSNWQAYNLKSGKDIGPSVPQVMICGTVTGS